MYVGHSLVIRCICTAFVGWMIHMRCLSLLWKLVKVDRAGYELNGRLRCMWTLPSCTRCMILAHSLLAPESWREYPTWTRLVSPLHTGVVSRHARATFSYMISICWAFILYTRSSLRNWFWLRMSISILCQISRKNSVYIHKCMLGIS